MSRKTTIIGRAVALGVLAILIIALGLPALLGWQLARVHDRYVQQLAIPGVLEVRDSQFSRGLLRSRSRIKLALAPALCGEPPCPVVTIDSVIHHGPIPFTAPPTASGGLQIERGVIVSQIDLAPLFEGAAFQPALPRLEIVTRVDLAGAAKTRVSLPAARLRTHTDKFAGLVNMEALQAKVRVPASYDTMLASLTWPDFKFVADAGGQLAWQDLHAKLSGKAATPMFWRGLEVGLDTLQWVDSAGQTVAMQGLIGRARIVATPQDRRATEFNVRMSRLAAHNREYGPVIAEGQVRGLDVISLQALHTDLRNLGTRRLPPELLLLRADAIYQTYISDLLAASPDLRITRFLAGTPDGDIVGDLHVLLPRKEQLESTAVADVLRGLELTLNLRLPAALLQSLVKVRLDARVTQTTPPTAADVDAAITEMTKLKLVDSHPKEAAYSTVVGIENQNLTINGKVREGWQQLLTALAGNAQSP